MMTKKLSQIINYYTIPISTVPLFLSMASYLIENLAILLSYLYTSILYQNQVKFELSQENQATISNCIHNSFLQIRQALMDVYSSYSYFIVAMMLLHMTIYILIPAFSNIYYFISSQPHHQSHSPNHNEHTSHDHQSICLSELKLEGFMKKRKASKYILNMFILILQYSLNYYLMHLLLMTMSLFSSYYSLITESHTLRHTSHRVIGSLLYEPKKRLDKGFDRNFERVLELQDLDIAALSGTLSLQLDHTTASPINLGRCYLTAGEKTAIIDDQAGKLYYVNISDVNSMRIFYSAYYDDQLIGIDYYLIQHEQKMLYFTQSQAFLMPNISNPQLHTELTSNETLNYDPSLSSIVFSNNGSDGYFCSSDRLYYLNTDLLTFNRVWSLQCKLLKYFTTTNDRSLTFASYANSLYIFTISDSNSLNLVSNSSYAPYHVGKTVISSDGATLFVLRYMTDSDLRTSQVSVSLAILTILNISAPASPKILSETPIDVSSGLVFETSQYHMALFIDEMTLILSFSDSMIAVDVSEPTLPTVHFTKLDSSFQTVAIRSDGTMFIKTELEFKAITLLANIQLPDQISRVSNMTGELVSIDGTPTYITTSKGGRQAFLANDDRVNVYQISKEATLTFQETLKLPSNVSARFISLSDNSKKLYILSSDNELIFMNLETKETKSTGIMLSPTGARVIPPFQVLPDSETLIFWSVTDGGIGFVLSANISDPASIEDPQMFLNYIMLTGLTCFHTDGDTVFVGTDKGLQIYDIKGLAYPKLLNTLQDVQKVSSIVEDSDTQTLFVMSGYNNINIRQFLALNITNLTQIETMYSFNESFIQPSDGLVYQDPIIFSEDSKLVLVASQKGFTMLNMTNESSPDVLGSIPIIPKSLQGPSGTSESSTYEISSVAFSSYSNSVLLSDSSGLRIIRQPSYIVGRDENIIKLGELSILPLPVLVRNSIGRYNMFSDSFKFMNMLLYDNAISSLLEDASPYKPLPFWMAMDIANKRLNLNPNSNQAVGSYKLYATISTLIRLEDFDEISTDPRDVFVTLISLGYLDNNGYMTASCNPNQPLVMPSTYNETTNDKILQVLRSHSIETLIPITVVSSLELQKDSGFLQIATLSQLSLSVSITLSATNQQNTSKRTQTCRFLHDVELDATSTIQSTVVSLQGTLNDVNVALKLISIDLDEGIQSCGGKMTINDGLNPPFIYSNDTISDFFSKNKPPTLNSNVSLQKLINTTPISTGNFFSISLDNSLFSETNLDYSLVESASVPWLSLNNMYLSGTPPEKIWPPQQMRFWRRDYYLTLVAKNEFKSATIGFTITVYISMIYAVKLLAQLFGIIGGYVYFPMLLNIFGRAFYRYPKTFFLKPGEDIALQGILPTALIAREYYESRFLIKNLENEVRRDLKGQKTRKKGLVQYFLDDKEQIIDRARLYKAVQDAAFLLFAKKQDHYIRIYLEGSASKKQLIEQLILNELVMRQIGSRQEMKTKAVFEMLKPRWLDLIQRDEIHPWQFSIDLVKLGLEVTSVDPKLKILAPKRGEQGQDSYDPMLVNDSYSSLAVNILEDKLTQATHRVVSLQGNQSPSKMKSLDVELLRDKETSKQRFVGETYVNLSLLGSAIVAHAFRKQHLNTTTAKVRISLLEKVQSSFAVVNLIKRFLKLNLRLPILINTTNKGYGIDYETIDEILYISGTPNKGVQNKTFMIQVTTLRNRILREILLYSHRGGISSHIELRNGEVIQEKSLKAHLLEE